MEKILNGATKSSVKFTITLTFSLDYKYSTFFQLS